MPKLLHVQSSPNLGTSVSRSLTEKFVNTWVSNHAGYEVEELDLVANPLPHFGAEILQAAGTPAEKWSQATRDGVALCNRLVTQVEEAQILVIGVPMINFTICSQLKVWLDHITVAGRTFQYSAPGVAKGLLFGKKVFVVLARGGDYADLPINAFDFQEPLLRVHLGFLGMYDVSFIRAQGLREKPEHAADIVRYAESMVTQLAS
jgi:FMN-dependent NADH-azoreductase